nr:reverse transcriptase domain-containing protein [Tanacetum cinerariifolium]
MEDKVVNILEKEKANLETIESLKSKSFESSEKVSYESENQSENDCLVVENVCDKEENPKVIAPRMFKLNVSQCVSQISMSKSSCDSNNVEIKLKRKRRKRKSSKQNVKQVDNDVSRANSDFVHFSDLDTFSNVRRPKNSGVIWNKKGSSNTSNVGLSAVSVSNLNKNVKRYSRKDLLACNNSHLGETSSAYMCNNAMNVSCDSRMNDLLDDNNFFIFNDVIVRISPVSRMLFRKKPCDSMNFLETVRFGNNDFAVIAGYGDVVIGSMTIKKVYYVEGLGHNLSSVGQFCDNGLEVAFRKSTCFVRNEDGVDLLTDEASEVIISFIKKTQVNLQLQVQRVRTDNGTEFKNKTLAKFFDEVGITQQFSAARTPQQNGKSSNLSVSQVDEASKKDLEDLFQDFYDEYFHSSKIMKSPTTNVETSINDEVFHEISKSFQGESSSSSLNDDVQQSSKEVILPQTNTRSIHINKVSNGDEASTSHNVFNERLEDAYFDASTSFHDPSNVQTYYQPYPHEKKWTKDHPLHKIIGDPKSSVRTRGQLANSCLFSCLLSSIEPANVAEALRDADWGANQGQNQPQAPAYQALVYQAPVHQPQIPQPQVVTTHEFTNFMKANDVILKNMQTNMNSLTNSNLELKNMFGQFMKMNTASSSGSGTLPGNTITNLKEDLKGITTRSGTVYQAPTIPTSSSPVVKRETEATKDTVHPTNNGSTKDIQPLVVPTESPILNSELVISFIIEPVASLVSALKPNQRTSIPYPSRLHDQKLCDKANDQREKFFQIFKGLYLNISFVDALILMPKFGPSIKSLLTNKDKLCELARTPLNEHCSAVLLNKLPEKLGDADKFLIPCDFPGMAECLALTDLGANINLMPLSVWNKLSLPDLSPTCMTLELADRSISRPVKVAEDVFVKVGTFHFPADFVVVDFDADPRVPLILWRSFLKIGRALIDVFKGGLTLRVGKEAITFNLDQTSRYSANYNDMMTNRIDVINMACEEYSQEVLGFSDVIANDPTLPEVDQSYVDTEGDILLLEAFLNDDPSLPPPNQGNYLPQVRKELKIYEAKSDKSSIDEPPEVKLKDLPPHLEYAFLKGDDKLPVIIVKDLSVEENSALITVLKSHKRAIAWKLSDIKGNYLPEVHKELKIREAKSDKFSINEPLEVELKDLPPHLEYAFLEGNDKFPVIIAKDLSVEEKTALITVMKSHKRAIAWKLSDIKEYPTRNSSSTFPSNLPKESRVLRIVTGQPKELIEIIILKLSSIITSDYFHLETKLVFVRNKMHKAFPLMVKKFPLPKGTSHCLKKNATARRKVLSLLEVCTAIIVKEKPSVKDDSFL